MSKCALDCRRPVGVGNLCFPHFDTFARMLDPDNTGSVFDPKRPDDPRVLPSIPALYGWLDAQPARRGIGSQALSGVFGSRPPCDLDVLVHRDPRSRLDEEGRGRMSVPTLLGDLVARVDRTDVDGRLEARPEPTLRAVCAWLYARREWLAAQPWVGEAWAMLRALQSQLRGVWGDPAMRPLGRCLKLVDDDGRLSDVGEWSCGVQLYLPEQPPKALDEPLSLPRLRCGACGWTYSETELVLLSEQRWRAMQKEQAS